MADTQTTNSHSKRKITIGALGTSALFHGMLFILVGGAVIVERIIPKAPITAEVAPSVVAESTEEPTEEAEPSLSPEPSEEPAKEQSTPTDVFASPDVMTSLAPSPTFTMSAPVGSAVPGLPGAGSKPDNQAGVSAPKSGKVPISFFGIESQAERIGFYLDFSGSMKGPLREKMIKEMEKSLKDLPNGMEVLIIPWAGPAWNLEETAQSAMPFWKSNSLLDWTLVKPEKASMPTYFVLSSSVRKKISKFLEETVQSPGGTDWRSPFRFAARVKNPPDVIYLMTDGQTSSYEKMEEGIGEALKAANTPRAIVNVVSFNSEIYDAKHRLKDLARKYSGQYIEIK